MIVEIKPYKQTVEPKVKKRKTRGYIFEVVEYAKIRLSGVLPKNGV